MKFETHFEDAHYVYILMRYCPNKTLNDLLKARRRLHELEVKCYVRQIIEGLKHLKSKRVLHRDLKLSNIFLTEKMEVKIGDFGLSAKLQHAGQRRKSVCGTPSYIAPEILDHKEYSHEVDVWALGVIIYTLLVGRTPF